MDAELPSRCCTAASNLGFVDVLFTILTKPVFVVKKQAEFLSIRKRRQA